MARAPLTDEELNPLDPATRMVLNVESMGITPDKFFRLCTDNPDLSLELTAQKEIVIMPPTGGEGDSQNLDITMQLGIWVKRTKNGKAFGPTAGFTLPNGAIRSPDAAWIRLERWLALSKERRRKLLPLCPEFVIELRSPSNTLRGLKNKMTEYIENGAQLGWLIDPFSQSVYVYRPGQPVERLDKPASVKGDPTLPGFILDLAEIWEDASA